MPVVLLCHCDGTNGSTTFTDVSPSAHALTASTATVSTTAPKFGTGSADFTASSGGRILVGGSAADFNLGAGQFTVEAWAYFTSGPTGVQAVLTQFGGSSNLGWFFGMSTGALYFFYSTTGTDNPAVGQVFTPTLNQWYHLAADRDAANVLRVYINGVVVASATVASTIFPSTQACLIGNDNNFTRGFPGRLDEVRIVTGTAMYGGAFTPPTIPFSLNTAWSTTDKTAGVGLTNGNLTTTISALGLQGVRTVDRQISGKWYFEYTFVNVSTSTACGIASQAAGLGTILGTAAATTAFAAIVTSAGGININGTNPTTLAAPSAGSVIGLALDLANQLIWFRLGAAGNWNNSASANPATGAGGLAANFVGGGIPAYGVMSANNATGGAITANFGDTAFTGAVPAGFTSGFTAGATPPLNEVATQVGVEEWGFSNPAMQATQVGVEQWGRSANPGIITQVSAEHWAAASPDAAVTQALVEHWGTVSTISTQAVVTQVLVEHWVPAALAARPRRVVCVSG